MSLKDLEKCSIADGFKPPTAQMNGKRYAPKNFMFRISFGGSKKSYPLIKNVFQDGASKETAATTVFKRKPGIHRQRGDARSFSLLLFSLKRKPFSKFQLPVPAPGFFVSLYLFLGTGGMEAYSKFCTANLPDGEKQEYLPKFFWPLTILFPLRSCLDT